MITDFQGCCGKAKGLVLKALEMDHDLAEAHAALAFAVFCGYDFVSAERELSVHSTQPALRHSA